MKALFVSLLVLAIGIGILVYGLTVAHVVELFGQTYKVGQGNPVFISIGAGLSVFGLGALIAAIGWRRK